MAPALSKDLRDRVVQWRIQNMWSYRKLADIPSIYLDVVQAKLLEGRDINVSVLSTTIQRANVGR